MTSSRRWLAGAALLVLTAPLLAACSSDDPGLVVYNAQHEELIDAVAKAFTKKTGIEVELRNGSDLELAQPARRRGRRVPGRRLPDRELSGHDAGGQQAMLRPLDAEDPRPGARPVPPRRRRVDRLRRLGRPCWSTTPTRSAGRTAGVDHGPGQARVEGPDLVLADRRRLPGDRQRGPRDSRASRPPRTGWQASRRNGDGVRRQQRRARVGELRREAAPA